MTRCSSVTPSNCHLCRTAETSLVWLPGIRSGGRVGGLWGEFFRNVSGGGLLCGEEFQGDHARPTARRASRKNFNRHQLQDPSDARPANTADAALPLLR